MNQSITCAEGDKVRYVGHNSGLIRGCTYTFHEYHADSRYCRVKERLGPDPYHNYPVKDFVWICAGGLAVPPKAPEPQADTKKLDQGKLRFDLFDSGFPLAVSGVVDVMTWAVEVKGYEPHSWREVQDAIRRYSAALSRHRNLKEQGERYDKESGKLHDFHIAFNALAVAQLEAEADRLTKQ